ncbi:hypothetical protein Clacol_005294 [Clathrus columnatus]|uniref:Nephrocystin 3-like N-terminal domain-containing protein n=1 Tax=Clathrus columnatus TaxID=1419009 RepID=A0AAV5AD54_9AGAM|nr:hypothetical protein Clacol_005294 [Clathrus columnatus]
MLMDKVLKKFNKKKSAQTSSNIDNEHARLNSILASDRDLNRGKLAHSMGEVSQVLDDTRDITGNRLERDNKAYRYKEVASNVVRRLSSFTNLVQTIADAHPYSKMAWTIISGVVTIITNTQDVDQDILDLFETLDATYKFIEDTKEIENYPSYKRILSTLAKQTVDCAYFIRDYAKNANFCTYMKLYQENNVKTIVTLRGSCRKECNWGSHQNKGPELSDSEVLYLDSLPYAVGAGLNTGKQCLFGTRREVLDEIVDWINDGDKSCPKLFWLAGAAGVGKSAIAHSIAVQFESIGRLGSFFCFDRNYPLERRRDKIFSTIARDLADLDSRIKHELAKVIRNRTSLRTTTDPHLQWKNLIFEPLNAIADVSTGPILIIVDALDECDNPSSRQDLLKVLEAEITSLPINIRVLITSRPENDIMLTFNKLRPHIRIKMMDTIPESESKRDILTYLKANLDSFGDSQLTHLVGLSQGLFQWAYLASQFLNGLGNSAGLTATERYENLIRTQHIRSINDPLDTMYTQILSSLFDTDDSLVMTRFRSTIGSIIASSEPLSLQTLVALRGDKILSSKRESDIKVVIRYMGSLLSGIDDPSSIIRPLHLSFREYLLDPNRSHKFSINPSPCHHDFAVGCIRIMMEGLRFNICDIPDSHKCNSDYEDLPERVLSSISIPLSYSCRFWALHVSWTAFDSSLARKVEEFLYHGFLLWLEVLSLIKAGEKSHKGLYDFAVDGKRFVRLFGDAIAASVPHIYLSALPFCPQGSIIYKTYIKGFPNTLRIASEPIHDWSLASIGSDVGYIDCISFSHGGEYLAITSLFDLGVFKLLDSETFDILWTEEVLANEVIRTIQFASGDRTLVLATETRVYFFDILMGGLTLHWEVQLTYGEIGLSWETRFSQNARYLAFFYKSHLIVWNLETEEETIDIAFDDQYIHIAGFEFLDSDNGLFVTYFANIGAQVWDLETGAVLHGPFQPPQNFAIAIDQTIISPNGEDIFFIDEDRRLHKWNFRDQSLMAFHAGRQPLIYGVSISPNGDCVISESLGRLALRDMNGNELHCEIDSGTFRKAFSKDGKHLASCDRGRLNIWELDGWQTTPNIQQSTLPPDDGLQFQNVSSDGKYFLARTQGSDYEIWNIESEQSIQKLNRFETTMLPIFSPLNRYLAYIPDGQTATIYDIHPGITKEFKFRLHDEKTHIQDLAFSQDETRMATLDLSLGRICIWDIASCQIVDTLTIPKAKVNTMDLKFWAFIASSKFRYFAYFYSNKDNISLLSKTRSIPVNFFIGEQVYNWRLEDFLFNSDEEYILVSCGPTIFYINLITEEHRAVALQRNHISDIWSSRRIHFVSSSDAVLVEIHKQDGYNIWNAFSGQLLYFSLLEYPDICIDAFIPVHRYLFSQTSLFCRILTLDAKRDDLISFSSNKQHSLKNPLLGSSARLRQDGWGKSRCSHLATAADFRLVKKSRIKFKRMESMDVESNQYPPANRVRGAFASMSHDEESSMIGRKSHGEDAMDSEKHRSEKAATPDDEEVLEAVFDSQDKSLELDPLEERRLLRFLDRVNIGQARLAGLEKDLKLHGNQYDIALTIFFVSYVAFELPSNLVLKKFKPQRWIFFLMTSWAIMQVAMGLVTNAQGLYATRFLLGMFESGLFPGLNFVFTTWYTRKELNFRVSIFFMGATLAGAFGGILAFGIRHMAGVGGKDGWAWIPIHSHNPFPTDKAKWLHRLTVSQGVTNAALPFTKKQIIRGLTDWRTYVYSLIYLAIAQPFYSLSLFVPSIIAALGFTNARANLLSAAPYALGTGFTLLVAYISDRYTMRAPVIAATMLLTTIGYIILLCSVSNTVKFIAVFIAVLGTSPAIATAITFVVSFGPMYTRAAVMGIFFSFGNSAGIISSNVYPAGDAPRYIRGHAVALAFSVLAIILSVFMTVYNKRENNRRDRIYGVPNPDGSDCSPIYADDPVRMKRWGLEGKTKLEIIELGDSHPAFRILMSNRNISILKI